MPSDQTKHPIQPVVIDANGVHRFKRNAIVEHLLEHGGIDLNALARLNFTADDREQFAQLIGYSVSGFSDLPFASDRVFDEGMRQSRQLADGILAHDEVAAAELIAAHRKLLDLFACPAHGSCVPFAIAEVGRMRDRLRELEAELRAQRGERANILEQRRDALRDLASACADRDRYLGEWSKIERRILSATGVGQEDDEDDDRTTVAEALGWLLQAADMTKLTDLYCAARNARNARQKGEG